jgi:xanthine/uracil permease
MSNAIRNTARACLLLAVVLLAGVGMLYVLDILQGEAAKDIAKKVLLASGVLLAGSVAVVLLGSARGGGPTPR